MAVAVIPYQRQKEDKESDLDKVIKGLNIAHSAFGIYGTYKGIEAAKQNQLMEQERLGLAKNQDQRSQQLFADEQQGVLNPKDLFAHGDKYTYSQNQTPNSVALQVRGPEGLTTQYATPRPKEVDPMVQVMREQNLEAGKLRMSNERLAAADRQEKKALGSPEQNKTAGFALRMEDAEKVLSGLNEKGFDPSGIVSGAQTSSLFPERLKSEEFKKYEQAKRNFIAAVLRRESGAAISPQEYEEGDKQYFPQAGDSPENMAQKENSRRSVYASFAHEAGPLLSQTRNERDRLQGTNVVNAPVNQKTKGIADLIGQSLNKANAGEAPATPKVIIQGGHQYILNPKTGQYE